MLTVTGKMVLCDHKNVDELLQDMQNVIATFVSISKGINIPDETIEKTLVGMIDTAFRHQDDLYNQHIDRESFENGDLSEIVKKAYDDAKKKGIL